MNVRWLGALASVTALLLALPSTTAAGGGITLLMTVGIDPTPDETNDDECAITESIKAPRRAPLDICYDVQNSSGVSLGRHDLTDSELGVILDDFPFNIPNGTGAFITQSVEVGEKTTFQGHWVAASSSQIHQAFDKLTVKVATCPGYKDDMRAHVIGSNVFDSLNAPDTGAVMCGLGDRDDLFGGDGKDLLIGGEGKDTMIGGGGKDTCLVDKKDIAVDCEKEKKA